MNSFDKLCGIQLLKRIHRLNFEGLFQGCVFVLLAIVLLAFNNKERTDFPANEVFGFGNKNYFSTAGYLPEFVAAEYCTVFHLEYSTDCEGLIAEGINVCALLQLDPENPVGTLDCDGDGWTNLEECNNNTNWDEPCAHGYASVEEICTFVIANPTSGLALADCDNGGVGNGLECMATPPGNPSTPDDDCAMVLSGVVNVCTLLEIDPMNPLALLDCDGDGWSNLDECSNSDNFPTNPTNPCSNLYTSQEELCSFILANPASPLALEDCDLGGILNLTECNAADPGNPIHPGDDCDATIGAGLNICAILELDPDSPAGLLDCDGDGWSNFQECMNMPATDPRDACSNLFLTGNEICSFVIANPASELALADCDNSGIANIVECTAPTPGNPLDPADDCNIILNEIVDVCVLLQNDPANPLGDQDCDGDGWTNLEECSGNGTLTSNPIFPCSNLYTSQEELCTFVITNPTSTLASEDCDLGGISNLTECNWSQPGNPLFPYDDCEATVGNDVNICAILEIDPTNPVGLLDCDGDGWSNLEECTGIPPTNPKEPCSNLYTAGNEICAFVMAYPMSELALADCDNGGIHTIEECSALMSADPLNPDDDCAVFLAGNIDVCTLLEINPSNLLATQDCDGDGFSNLEECNGNGGLPTNPKEPCSNFYTSGSEICTFISNNPGSPLATADCDLGGIINLTECNASFPGDPLDPFDDCDATIGSQLNICAILEIDPTSPVGLLDCDGDGWTNLEECSAAPPTNPNDPCSNLYLDAAQICTHVLAYPNNPLALQDCDNGGEINLTECLNGTNPIMPGDDIQIVPECADSFDACAFLATSPADVFGFLDCDEDGFNNAEECNGNTNVNDACDNLYTSGIQLCAYLVINPASPLALLDCDNGGVINITECNNGSDPTLPDDDLPDGLDCSGDFDICSFLVANPSDPIGFMDCDDDGFSNAEECNGNTDLYDPCDNLYTEGIQLCAYLVLNQDSPLAFMDCDNGGVMNKTECINGTNPFDPDDDMPDYSNCGGNFNICTFLSANPNADLGFVDCDGDGFPNAAECEGNTNPNDACDHLFDTGAKLCEFIFINPDSPLAFLDCDNGGVSNLTECQGGSNPLLQEDDMPGIPDCNGVFDVCAYLVINPADTLGLKDCDGDGFSNNDECNAGTDVYNACDNLYTTGDELCAFLVLNPNSMLAFLDCDNGGVMNFVECQEGNDPLLPEDDNPVVPACDGFFDACAYLVENPADAFGLLDCDGDGFTNLEECNGGTDVHDACDNLYASGMELCAYLVLNPNNPLALLDCDNGGVPNFTECENGNDPFLQEDDNPVIPVCDSIFDMCGFLVLNPADTIGLKDCDKDGFTNLEECSNGTDVYEACDNLYTSGEQLCAYLVINPDSPLAFLDCDGGTVMNITECEQGQNPLDPEDDLPLVPGCFPNFDICAHLVENPADTLAFLDCDEDGFTNLEECEAGTDVFDACDNLYTMGEELCAFLVLNPGSPLATLDCDGGGFLNVVECQGGMDPFNPLDDCDVMNNSGIVCNNNIQVSLGDHCEAEIVADMVLEGTYNCEINYTVEIADTSGMLIGNLLGPDQIGQTLTVTVHQLSNSNSCWGTISVEDKNSPTMECLDSISYICTVLDSVLNGSVGEIPVATDACGETSVDFSDELVSGENCDTTFLYRTWIATDESGNMTTCEQVIYFLPASLDQVVLPQGDNFDCLLSMPLNAAGNPAPEYTGFPKIGGVDINTTTCNLLATYSDDGTPNCDGSYEIIRHWTVLDWCTASEITQNQVIRIIDTIPPVVTCESSITVFTNNNNCSATIDLDDYMPQIAFDCSVGISTTSVISSSGVPDVNMLLELSETDCSSSGPHLVTFTVTNGCNNTQTCTMEVNVVDNVAPQTDCAPNAVVNIAPEDECEIVVMANAFAGENFDNCGTSTYRLARMFDPQIECSQNDTVFAESIRFTCCDIGNTIAVVLEISDGCGNSSTCVSNVLVQDDNALHLVCPDDLTVSCDDNYSDFTQFGEPAWSENLEIDTSLVEVIEVDGCASGQITRTWTATDATMEQTGICTQTITIEHVSDFEVYFPGDVFMATCDSIGASGEPVISGDFCELVAVSHDDQVFEDAENACFKIFRTWSVVNWCVFDFNNPANTESGISLPGECNDDDIIGYDEPRNCHFKDDGDGYFRWTQVIKIGDDNPPEFLSLCEDITVCDFGNDCGDGYADLTIFATDACTENTLLEYHHRLQLDTNNDSIPDTWTELREGNDASSEYPYGRHLIRWEVGDRCGNFSICEYYITVVDCKKPTPVLTNGLTTVIMPSTGEVTLSATDYNAAVSGSFDNCTAPENLEFYIRIIDDNTMPLNDLDEVIALGSEAVFTCNNIDSAVVEVYVVDEYGNWDFAETYTLVQDVNEVCMEPQAYAMAGAVFTEENDRIADVEISVSGSASQDAIFITDNSGTFALDAVANENLTIVPQKDDIPSNGVTTLDLVFISKHILNIQPLDSPYKIIAADANRSNSVTTLDLVLVRQLILGINDGFANNTSWRFIDADYIFPDPSNPFTNGNGIPEIISINGVDQEELNLDFVGIKIGDVNNSAVPNAAMRTMERTPAGHLDFILKNQKVQTGKSLDVVFKAKDFKNISGFQFTLQFDKNVLNFNDVYPGAIDLDIKNCGTHLAENGLLTFSWNDIQLRKFQDETTLFKIAFDALGNGQLSQLLAIGSAPTLAQAYGDAGALLSLGLSFDMEYSNSKFTLLQNQPNPFDEETAIGFNLSKANEVTLTVFGMRGTVLYQTKKRFTKGYHEIILNQNDLKASGLLFYRMDVDGFSAMEKMLLIE